MALGIRRNPFAAVALAATVALAAAVPAPSAGAAPATLLAPPGTELISNGEFDDSPTSLAPWSWRNDIDASLALVHPELSSSAAQIDVPSTGSRPHVVQLRAPVQDIVAGHRYAIRIFASASETRTLNVRLQSFAAPYRTAAATDIDLIGRSQPGFSLVEFTARADLQHAFLGFNLAQDTGTILLRSVSMMEIPADGGLATEQSIRAESVAVDSQGNLYVGTDPIQKVSPTGVVSRLPSTLGTGVLAVDAADNLYVGSPGSYLGGGPALVRKLTPAGVVSTVAGTGFATFDASDEGVPATEADLAGVTALTVAGDGSVFIGDHSRVRKVTPDGIIHTVAGGGGSRSSGVAGTKWELYRVNGLVLDPAGNLYISDGPEASQSDLSMFVVKLSTAGIITRFAGSTVSGFSGDGGPAVSAGLDRPWGLARDAAGNVFVADAENGRIRRVAPDGTITTVAGTGANGPLGDGGQATAARLGYPMGLAIGADGVLYVVDDFTRVRAIATDGIISTVAGNGS